MKGLISWFAQNHVAANLLMIFLLVAGAVVGLNMKVEVFPDASLDMISITVKYPGAAPSEIEEAIVRPIEEKIAGLAGIKQIDSISREGVGSVTIEVMKGWNVDTLLDDVKAEVDRITSFPRDAEEPIVQKLTRRTQVLDIAIHGEVSEHVLKKLAQKIKDEITSLPGITLAELFGVRDDEIHIELSENTLRKYGLTLEQVASIIRQQSLDLPLGTLKTKGFEILLRAKDRRYFAKDFASIPIIALPDGTKICLGDIATLKDDFEDKDLFARFHGKPASVIRVYRVANQNALKVAATVKKYIEEIRPTLPEGVGIEIYRDRSIILKGRIKLLLKNMAIGLVLVILLLGFFLNIRLSFWVTLGIPVSFMSALIFLPHFDVSINMVSLFAFIMVLGIVVDDAIVIGENIFRKREEGISPLEAATFGAVQVGRPVIFSVLTTVVAFWPLLLGSGMMGKIMRNLPIVVILVLLGSLTESLLILPSHLARSRFSTSGGGLQQFTTRWLKRFIEGPYKKILILCLRWRYITIAFGIAILMLTFGIWKGNWIKFTFFPKVEGDTLMCYLTMPVGTPVERTIEVTSIIEKAAEEAIKELDKKRPGAPSLFKYTVSLIGIQPMGHGPLASGGRVGGHLAKIYVRILEAEKRDVSARRLAMLWRKKVGIIPDAESIIFQSHLFSAGNPIEVDLSIDNQDVLISAAEDLKKRLYEYPGVFDITDSFLPGKEEMHLKLKPSASTLGVSLWYIASQIRNAFYGAEALKFQRDKDEVKVVVLYPKNERRSLSNVEDMFIRLPDGREISLRELVSIEFKRGYVAIERTQRRKVIKVSADVNEKIANASEIRADLEKHILPLLISKYPGLKFSMGGEGKEQKESMQDVIRGLIIALFCIYALLAIPFKSFTQPFIVMLAIPFGIVGAILGHIIMGLNLSILSMFGIVGLSGVVVNDSLLLIHTCNRLRYEEKMPIFDSVVTAGGLRFRAIILTSLTTFAGLTPMIIERSLQAKFLIPMAVSLGFGVLFATGITLLLIPCGYMILEDIHTQFVERKKK